MAWHGSRNGMDWRSYRSVSLTGKLLKFQAKDKHYLLQTKERNDVNEDLACRKQSFSKLCLSLN